MTVSLQNKPLKLGASYALEFSPDGLKLAALGRFVWIWDCKSRSKQWRAHPFPNSSNVAFSPDGTMLAVKNTAGKIVVLDARDGSVVVQFEDLKDGEGSNIRYSSDGDFLVDGSWSGHLRVRDAHSGETVFQRFFPGEMIRRIHTDRLRQFWIIEHQPKLRSGENFPPPAYFTCWQWPLAKAKFYPLPMRYDFLYASALSPEGSRLATVDRNSLEVHRLPDGKLLASTLIKTGHRLCWSPDGSRLASVEKKQIALYSPNDLQCEHRFAMQSPSDVAWSPDGGILALGDLAAGFMVSEPFSDPV